MASPDRKEPQRGGARAWRGRWDQRRGGPGHCARDCRRALPGPLWTRWM